MILEKIEQLIRKILDERTFPCLARIEKTYTEKAQYYAECRELYNNGEETETVYIDVAVPKLWGTEKGGIWMTPCKGAVVLLSFLNGDRNYPIIAAVMGSGAEEKHPENELIIKCGEMELRIADKIVLKNAQGSLGEILGDMADKISNMQTIGAPSPHKLAPDQIAEWKMLKSSKIEGLFKE